MFLAVGLALPVYAQAQDLQSAQTALDNAYSRYYEQASKYASGKISQQEYLDADNALDSAKVQLGKVIARNQEKALNSFGVQIVRAGTETKPLIPESGPGSLPVGGNRVRKDANYDARGGDPLNPGGLRPSVVVDPGDLSKEVIFPGSKPTSKPVVRPTSTPKAGGAP